MENDSIAHPTASQTLQMAIFSDFSLVSSASRGCVPDLNPWAQVAPHMAEVRAVEAPLWLNGEYFKVRATFPIVQRQLCYRCHHCKTQSVDVAGLVRPVGMHEWS